MNPKIITELYAFVSTDIDGNEGVVGMQTPEGWMPLIGADMDRVESMVSAAKEIQRVTGQLVFIKKFRLDDSSPLLDG